MQYVGQAVLDELDEGAADSVGISHRRHQELALRVRRIASTTHISSCLSIVMACNESRVIRESVLLTRFSEELKEKVNQKSATVTE